MNEVALRDFLQKLCKEGLKNIANAQPDIVWGFYQLTIRDRNNDCPKVASAQNDKIINHRPKYRLKTEWDDFLTEWVSQWERYWTVKPVAVMRNIRSSIKGNARDLMSGEFTPGSNIRCFQYINKLGEVFEPLVETDEFKTIYKSTEQHADEVP